MQDAQITHQVLVFGPRANRHTKPLGLDVLESGFEHPALQLGAYESLDTRVYGSFNPGFLPFVDHGALNESCVFGVVLGIKVLKFGPTAGFRVLICLTKKFLPVTDSGYHISNVNIVKGLRKRPWLLAIINLKLDIGGYPTAVRWTD